MQPDLVGGNSAHSKELELHDLSGPLQTKPFYDSMTAFLRMKSLEALNDLSPLASIEGATRD